MIIKIFILLLSIISFCSAEEKYLYFDDNNIFAYKKNNINKEKNSFYKLKNRYSLSNSKFDIKYFTKKEFNKDKTLNLKKNIKYRLDKNAENKIYLDIKSLEKDKSITIFNDGSLIDKINFPYILKNDQIYLIKKNYKIKNKNIFSNFVNLLNKKHLLSSDYDNFRKKIKIRNLQIPFKFYEHNLILIETNENIKEIFIKFKRKDEKHYAYFNKKILTDGNLQFFSVIEDTVNKAKHFDIVKKKSDEKLSHFHIEEIQLVVKKNENNEKFLNSISLLKSNSKGIENFDTFYFENNLYQLNIENYLSKNFSKISLENIEISSDSNLYLNIQSKYLLAQLDEYKNFNLSKLKQKILNDNNFLYAELTPTSFKLKINFIFYSILPLFILGFLILIIKIPLQLSKKHLSFLKFFFYLCLVIFLILILTSTNIESLKYLSFYSYFILVLIYLNYLFLKKNSYK